ncbi:hypothetical protein [Flavobacterium ajazii]|uniref:hypothetical protein n=1 Tax=Flavobacterium ajazii TaxID=2692318 RepID=UPI0013D782E2|nr:hypothetical protein [Flavobacterium ajazii]
MLLLLISCAVDKVERDETQITNPENVWIYDGESVVLKNVIADLKNGEYRESLERRLSKNEVIWEEAKFLLIDGKKRILVPFLSKDKENVIGVLTLVKDDKGKTTFEMTSRTQLKTKNNKLPFWNKGTWAGYFMALDRNILNIKNGNPGLAQIQLSEEKTAEIFGTATAKSLKTCRQQFAGYSVSFYAAEEQCDVNLESTNCYYFTTIIYVPVYEEVCWEDGQPAPQLPDPPALPDPVIPTDPNYVPGAISYNNINNFTQASFLAYVKSETYSISSPIITNTYGEGCITKVKIVNSVFAYDIEIEQLLNRNASVPFYYVNGVTSYVSDFLSFWVNSNNAEHWMNSYNNYFENSISIVEYEGESRYKVSANGMVLFSVPAKYKIEINSHTGEILSISRIED